jgi:hypothetical protein
MVKILALDPGDTQTGYALIEMPEFKLTEFGKVENRKLLDDISRLAVSADSFAIEMIASYGMPVGKSVFDTCVWIGRFWQRISEERTTPVDFIYRKDEKISICGSMKAKDANIRQELINRYARHDFKTGKGTKANPDTFYGVAADAWQAIAVGVTWYEKNADK